MNDPLALAIFLAAMALLWSAMAVPKDRPKATYQCRSVSPNDWCGPRQRIAPTAYRFAGPAALGTI
jgi:hypothetical protein